MPILLRKVALSLEEEESLLQGKAAGALQIPPEAIEKLRIVKKSLDARKKKQIHFVYTLAVSLPSDIEKKILAQPHPSLPIEKLEEPSPFPPAVIKKKPLHRPVIVGTGPAGLFAAMQLAASGCPPLIIERGKEVPARVQDVEHFWNEGVLNPESNVQFGEGGAGTFSDGKLYTRLRDPRTSFILKTFSRFGAHEEIQYLQKPHIGTDRLRRIIPAMREYLLGKGAEYKFQTRLTGLEIRRGSLQGIILNDSDRIACSALLLAIGNGARDTTQMLSRAGLAIEPKPFAIGLRVEHPQKLIDRIQYSASASHPRLPPAEYLLTYRSSHDRAVYSFCMCPGGFVIGATSEKGQIITNGMSPHQRNSPWANSALVVSVGPPDFPSPSPLAGVEFQRIWGEKAFHAGGGNYMAPVQRLVDFLAGRDPGPVPKTSFKPGVTPARLKDCLPAVVAEDLQEALPVFNRKMPGFCSRDAVLIGIETRTSSPVRMVRGKDFQSSTIQGLYPCGEGAGYAGGIISSALDGMKAAEAILKKFE